MAIPTGIYYSEKAPLLSTVAAICMGTRTERARFSVGHTYADFCEVGYGLTARQASTLLSAASGTAYDFDYACVPTPSQLDDIIRELADELAKPEPARVRPDLKGERPAKGAPILDPLLSQMFPTLTALYSYYILAIGSEPVDWEAQLRTEWWPELAWLW